MEKGDLEVSGLIYYPLKSGYPIEVDSLTIDNSGPLYDRSFCIVDKIKLNRLSMKDDPKVFYIKCYQIKNKEVVEFIFEIPKSNKLLSMKEMQGSEHVKEIVNLSKDLGNDIEIDVCGTKRLGKIVANEKLNKSLNEYLGKEYLLVYCHQAGKFSKYTYAKPEYLKEYKSDVAYMKYHDGAPLLIVQEEDIEELNSKISKNNEVSLSCSPINFRPNIIIKGGKPGLVEKADQLIINNCVFKRVFNCGRCKITTFDYNLGEFSKQKEPLNSLSDYKFDDILLMSTFGGYYYLESNLDKNDDINPMINLDIGSKVFLN
jgi:uncharacterized protein YcbX